MAYNKVEQSMRLLGDVGTRYRIFFESVLDLLKLAVQAASGQRGQLVRQREVSKGGQEHHQCGSHQGDR